MDCSSMSLQVALRIIWSHDLCQNLIAPVQSTGYTEAIAAGHTIQIGKTIARVYRLLLHMHSDLFLNCTLKKLYVTLTTQRQ